MEHFGELKVRLRRVGIFEVNFDCKSKIKTIVTRCGLYAIYTSLFLAPAWHLVFEAKTPIEQAESKIFVLISVVIISWYSAFLSQSEKYVALLDELNAIIRKSEWKQKTEKLWNEYIFIK